MDNGHWEIGDVAEYVVRNSFEMREFGNPRAVRVSGRTDVTNVRILDIIWSHSAALVEDIDAGGEPFHVALCNLQCDPELTFKHAGAWRDAGGRINEAR